MSSEPRTELLVIDGPVVERDVPRLGTRLRALLCDSDADVVVCDVRTLPAEVASIDALARLQLTARRLGGTIALRRASSDLDRLVAFVGLADVLPRHAAAEEAPAPPRQATHTCDGCHTQSAIRDVASQRFSELRGSAATRRCRVVLTDGETIEVPAMAEGERAQLLLTAADLLDRRNVTLGPGDVPVRSEEGDVARLFAQDRAELGRPTVHRLELSDANVARRNTPVTKDELTRRFRYYWVEFPVSLWTCAGRAFNCLQVAVDFNKAGDEAHRPIAFDAIPDQAFATRFAAESEVSVGVDAAFKFSAAPLALPVPVDAGVLGLQAEAHADVGAQASSKLIFGPFRCALRTPVVKRSAIGLPTMQWRLDESSFEDENDPGLRVVLRVPADVDSLQIGAFLEATRYYNLLGAGLIRGLRDLPKTVKDFFTGGTPIRATSSWDLSEQL